MSHQWHSMLTKSMSYHNQCQLNVTSMSNQCYINAKTNTIFATSCNVPVILPS